LQNVALVPTAAIQRGAPGTFVYLVKPNDTVAVQTVKLGPGDGQHVAILSGLQVGDQVVDDGADRLKDGAKITVAPPPGKPGATGAASQPGAEHKRGGPHSGEHRNQQGGTQQTSQ
jgi:multidrug efflux system membrane fusion protein